MVRYDITIIPLEEELQAADSGLLTRFYMDDTSFNGSTWRSAQILKILLERGPDQGYFPKTVKSLFIADSPDQEEAPKKEFVA